MKAIDDASLEASHDEQGLTGCGLFLGLKLNDSQSAIIVGMPIENSKKIEFMEQK